MTAQIFSLPVFGIILSIMCYGIGIKIKELTKSPLANPIIIANALLIFILSVTPITLEQYMAGGGMITLFIVPATTTLGLRIYRQRALLKANLVPILAGCIAGSVGSAACVAGLCVLFGIDKALVASLLPKSVTTAIAMELSAGRGGLVGITVSAVILTGIVSAALSPFFIKIFKLKDPVAGGIAMGASGHALATATALGLGEVEGAMSGLAMGIMGIITSVLFAFL